METVNSSSTRSRLNSLSIFSLLVAAALTVSGCDTLKRRGEVDKKPGVKQPAPVPTPGVRVVTPAATPTPAPDIDEPDVAPTPAPTPMPTPPPPPKPNNAKVGIILGPGGMKSYAHLGVLREMTRARIPVVAVAGMEWGAVMGGLYAQQGQINDAEWRSFKLKESEMPESGFLSSKLEPAAFSKLNDFMEAAFGDAQVNRAKLSFACPAVARNSERAALQNTGPMKAAVSKCLPYPPLFREFSGFMASPFSVEESAAWLRSRGANVILLVNVLGQGEFLPSQADATENLIWAEIRREMYRAKAPSVNHVIHVNTSGHPVTDFNGRRALMDAGQKSATEIVNKMVSQYGF